jgi:hypothetical protein
MQKCGCDLTVAETVYTTLEHVSRSGMMRYINAFVMRDNEPRGILGVLCEKHKNEFLEYAPRATYASRHEGFKMQGCGMDMGFQLVYSLASMVFRDGFPCTRNDGSKSGRRCPASDHTNGNHDFSKHMHTNSSGGYALRQSWL